MTSDSDVITTVLRRLMAAQATPLRGGHGANENFLVTIGNERYVCKVRRDDSQLEHLIVARVSSILEIRRVPHGRVVGRPERLRGRSMIVLEFVPGESLADAADQLTTENARTVGSAMGRWLGKLHAIRSTIPWAPKARLLFARRLEAARDILGQAVHSSLERRWLRLEPSLDGVYCALVHRDLDPSNILISDTSFTGIIDFEQARLLDPLYDLVKLNDFVFPINVGLARGFFDASASPSMDDLGTRARLTACAILEYLAAVRYFTLKMPDAESRADRSRRVAALAEGQEYIIAR